MKFELDLTRQIHEKFGFPVRPEPPEGEERKRIDRDEGTARRRILRVESDGLIREGLVASNMEEVCAGLAGTMTAVAGACLQLGVDPKVPDLVAAAKELIEDARVVLDQSIALSEFDQVAVGAVMMEIVCRGIAATLAVPYKGVLEACALYYVNGQKADRAVLKALLATSRGEPPAGGDATEAAAPADRSAAALPAAPANEETALGENPAPGISA